jgi:GGDEF domain-containing protein
MSNERRRLVLAAGPEAGTALRAVFDDAAFACWDVLEASTLSQAHFLLQHDQLDALLIDESLLLGDDGQGLAWLGQQRNAPLFLLIKETPELIAVALGRGVKQWLPRDLALADPKLLAAALVQVHETGAPERLARETERCLHECQRRVSRLLNLLWETSPADPQSRWLTQRHIMERLQEELARADRYGTPFSIALGEVETDVEARLSTWTTERLLHAKRAADIIGHYGPNGFMLLFVQTPAERAAHCCRRLQSVLVQSRVAIEGPHFSSVRIHFGLAGYSPDTATPQAILSLAEQRLDEARASVAAADTFR